MRNIVKLFKRDLQNVGHSVIGLIVVIGLVIVPVLYAWFNIAGSWDPYGNTGNLKIAVANVDDGYKSDLIPVKVNVGETVVSALHDNDSFDWTFVGDKEDAVEGVKSGKYYAAVVIPKHFSSDIMTLFSTEVKHSHIEYYDNQKMNAIGQIVTDKGSTAVQEQINESFTETIANVALSTTSSLLDYMGSDEVSNYVANLSSSLDTGISDLRDASKNTGTFAGTLGATSDLLASTGSQLSKTGTTSSTVKGMLKDAKSGLSDVEDALNTAVSGADSAISSSAGAFDSVESAVNKAFDAGSQHVGDTVSQLQSVSSTLQGKIDENNALISSLQAYIDSKGTDPGFNDAAARVAQEAINDLTLINGNLTKTKTQIDNAAEGLKNGTADIATTRKELKGLISDAKAGVSSVKGDYKSTLKSQTADLRSTLSGIASASTGISQNLNSTVKSLSSASGSLAKDLSGVTDVLNDTSSDLGKAADKLQNLRDKLDEAVQNGDLDSIRAMIGSDPETLAKSLSAPVGIDRKPVYHIMNYGSAMAPFYTILSIWIGAIVLAAMMKVSVDDRLINELVPVRLHEIYLGRYLLFAMLALFQSTLVCCGDILFFGIQCDNPFQFILAGWVASIVFSNIVYTLTVSFGDIGKALAVVLLVMQVGGSGGTFPIEMTAPVFQAIFPWLPFTHGINAMHAAMAGAYGMEYWIELGTLLLYLIPSLALGIVFRRPVIRANNWIIEKLEETKLM